MSYADFICAYWQILIAYALIPIGLTVLAFVLCRADRRSQVKQMHRMRQ
jgi:hypothetical protein